MSHSPRDLTVSSLAKALGRIPSGLFIVTVRKGPDETAMLASWLQQCSFEPPQVVLAVNRERYFLDWLVPGVAFTVNILAEGQTHLVKHFARGFEPGQPAFEGIEVVRSDNGTAHLAEAHAYLDCKVTSSVELAGDHVLIVGQVAAGAVQNDLRPMVHLRKNGLTY